MVKKSVEKKYGIFSSVENWRWNLFFIMTGQIVSHFSKSDDKNIFYLINNFKYYIILTLWMLGAAIVRAPHPVWSAKLGSRFQIRE